MAASAALYFFVAAAAAGALSIVRPIRRLGIRSRKAGWLVLLAGAAGAQYVLGRPALATYVTTPETKLDEFAPIYQFSEIQSIPVRAPAGRVYESLFAVTAAEVPLYRELAWIRRGGASGPESVLNPSDDVPLVDVATRTSFLQLAAVPGRELVLGAVVMAPPGVRLAAAPTPAAFQALRQPGFAKAAMGFVIEVQDSGWCRLRSEIRVHATDPASRDTFSSYWKVITPGSRLMHLMWLRAIKVRAEATRR